MKPAPTTAGDLYCSACERMFNGDVGEACPRDGTRLVKLVAAHDPFLGRDLDGRYVILAKLGQGGMGAVYRANQKSVDREVAIKVVSPQMMTDPAIIKRFLREARLASRISHPNAVGVLDFGQTSDGVFYLVMELVTGRTLESVLREEGALSPDRTIQIGMQVCLALEGAHAVPIVHRDLKPANVLVDANDLVKVLDFGIAKSLSPDTISSTMTNAGAIMGTPAFMPPELALGRPCDERADLYSLGCMLYVAVAGRLPFEAEALPEIMRKHASDPVPPLGEDVPLALAAVIYRLLEKQPEDRFGSAGETRLALERALARPSTSLPWGDAKPSPRVDPAATIPLRPRPTPEAPTIRQRSATPSTKARRAAWPWLLAATLCAGAGVAVVIAVDPFGTPPTPRPASSVSTPAASVTTPPAPAPRPSAPTPLVVTPPPAPTVDVPVPARTVDVPVPAPTVDVPSPAETPMPVAVDPDAPAKPAPARPPKRPVVKSPAKPIVKAPGKPVVKSPGKPVRPTKSGDEDPPPF